MKKIIFSVTTLFALFLSYIVLPDANNIIYTIILKGLMTVGFLWPIALFLIAGKLIQDKKEIRLRHKLIMAGVLILTMPLAWLVLNSLGEPFSKIAVNNEDKYNEIWLYTSDGACTWEDFAWKRKQVHFKDKLVVETHTGWSYD